MIRQGCFYPTVFAEKEFFYAENHDDMQYSLWYNSDVDRYLSV